MKNTLSTIATSLLLVTGMTLQAQQPWVSLSAKGKLVYDTTARGDKIMDFSYAGYKGGGVKIPTVPVKISLQPVAGDNSVAIQAAIDKVGALPLVNGWRGAVLLGPGNWPCDKTITLENSGVVLTGSGSQENGTVLQLTGTPHVGVVIKGIGCTGAQRQEGRPFERVGVLPEGTYVSHGTPVQPPSLYLQQLVERLGKKAVENID